ncbi:MAG TPA: uroporphyrinogen-III synthase [Candidatus Limnocylindria bacterium]|nr:uroporphyrinogen-III synthase [Candidatus Limnocylindria bacterium]
MRRRILVTRPAEQADELARLLHDRGLAPIVVPAVAIRPAEPAAIDAMLARLAGAAWLVVTSANGADALGGRLAATASLLPADLKIAAVGPATAAALVTWGIRVDHVPSTYRTAAIAEGLADVHGRRVVLARADLASPELAELLRGRGAVVEEVIAYHVIEGPAASRERLQRAIHRGLDGIAFTSGSTVRGVLRLATTTDRSRIRTLPAFCIGPPTAEVARRSGFDAVAVAPSHTAANLAETIAIHFARGTS